MFFALRYFDNDYSNLVINTEVTIVILSIINGKIMKLEGDSSLHFVSLRMTDTCVIDACHSERSEESPTFSRSEV
jgi:hypothetical protein